MKIEIGFKNKNKKDEWFEVLDKTESSQFVVRFENGVIRKAVSKQNVLKGNVSSNKPPEILVAELGKTYGKLTVIDLSNPVEPKVSCTCGKVLYVKRNPLIRGRTTNCGCSPVKSSSDKYWKKFQEFMASWNANTHKPSVKKLPLFEFKKGSVDFIRIKAFSYVDTNFYEYWKHYPFSISSTGYVNLTNNRYVYDKLIGKRRKGLKYQYKLHHLVRGHTNFQEYVVDHINGCKLDNRFKNLRTATITENCRNSKKTNRVNTSVYKGVSYIKTRPNTKRWSAYITWNNGKNSKRAYFETEIEAALQYNIFATEVHGEFAKLNIIKAP